MRQISFFSKLFLSFAAIIGIFSVLIVSLSLRSIKRNYINILSKDLKKRALLLRDQILPMLKEGAYKDIDRFVKKTGRTIKTRITVILPDGTVIADSEKDPSLMDNHGHRPEIRKALAGKIGRKIRYSRTMKEEMLYLAIPLEDNGKIVAVLRVSLFLRDINRLFSKIKWDIAEMAIFILLASLIISLLISKGLSSPLKKLAMISRKVSEGDFEAKIFLRTGDEFQEVSKAFNQMTSNLKILFETLQNEREELKAIITSINEGIILLDKDGKIIMSNEEFRKMVDAKEVEGKFYWEFIRDAKLMEMVREVKRTGENLKGEIRWEGKIFLCNLTHLEGKKAIIILFNNITEMKKIEEIKREFVINASHELKTPLTSIKGFLEALEKEENIKNREYLEIIKRNTERLINITSDLLLIAKLESPGFKLEKEEFFLKNLIEKVVEIFRPMAAKKNLQLTMKAEQDLRIKADPYLIEQVLINLIDNAIKYTEKGGVEISLMKDGNFARIDVKDTGIGIEERHLKRIFERFYVVDKSRSRKSGGTGLGLSIVKHIVAHHRGKVYVQSKPGEGSTFSVLIPI